MTPENELLRSYARTGSEEAFTELVRRHVNLVYSAALRQVGGDAHLAQDVAQTVFSELANKAASLSNCNSLSGWLYTSAYFAASKVARTEHRRRQREEQFMREPAQHSTPEADWEKLRPALDTVMHELNETDREAVLLRYFENRAFAEVGSRLNLNENAARMRVERALEKLRALLTKRGIATGAALASVISANAVQTAPGTMVAALASASLASHATNGLTLFNLINSMKLKICAGALVAAGGIVLVVSHNLHATTQNPDASAVQSTAQAAAAANTPSSNTPTAENPSLEEHQPTESTNPSSEIRQSNSASNSIASMEQAATNSITDSNKLAIVLKLKIVALSQDWLQGLRPAWSSPESGCGAVTAEQLSFINTALNKGGSYTTTESQIVTFNGRQTTIGARSPLPNDYPDSSTETMFAVLPFYSQTDSSYRMNFVTRLGRTPEDSSTKTNDITLLAGQSAVLQRIIPKSEFNTNSNDTPPPGPVDLLIFVTPEVRETNDIEVLATSKQIAFQAAARQKLNDSKQVVLAMLMYADEHQGRFPANDADISSYFKGDNAQLMTNFDILYTGSNSAITNPASTILLKEKDSTPTSETSWIKCYGFADGHSEIHHETNNDFSAFEAQHAAPAIQQ